MKNLNKARIWLAAGVIVIAGIVASNLRAEDKPEPSKEPKGAYLGVYPADLDRDARKELDYKGDGVLIEDVVDDGPADKAGIRSDDIVTKVAGVVVADRREFRKELAKHSGGEKIAIVVVRDGKEKSFDVTCGDKPATKIEINLPNFTWSSSDDDDEEAGGGFLGVVTETLEDDLATYFEVKSGVLVKSVSEDSPAEKAGIKPGDVIVKVGNESVESSDDLRSAVREHKPGEKVDVLVVRKGKETTIAATLGKSKDGAMRIEKRIIVRSNDDNEEMNDEIRQSLEDAMRDLHIQIMDGRDDLKEQMDELKQELEALKKELKEKKDK